MKRGQPVRRVGSVRMGGVVHGFARLAVSALTRAGGDGTDGEACVVGGQRARNFPSVRLDLRACDRVVSQTIARQ